MIDFIKEDDSYFLTLGYNFLTKGPKQKIPISKTETIEFAKTFNEDFAVEVGEGVNEWAFESFKLTTAEEHPYGWTDSRPRTLLHYNDQSWHMIAPEIAQIGKLAKRMVDLDA